MNAVISRDNGGDDSLYVFCEVFLSITFFLVSTVMFYAALCLSHSDLGLKIDVRLNY